jgi:hypothetical protein
MEVHEEFFCTKALSFKTPAKRKQSMDDGALPALFLLHVSIYSPFFKADEEAPITNLSNVTGVLAHLDDIINLNNTSILNFIAEYQSGTRKSRRRHQVSPSQVGSSVRHSWDCSHMHLAFDYLAPSTWASIGAMAEKLDKIGKALKTQGAWLDS